MNFLTAIIDGLVRFVQRNPLTTLVILILAVGAPALLRGIALFFLYFIMGVIVLVVAAILLFRWRVYKMRPPDGRTVRRRELRRTGLPARPLQGSLARVAKAK